MGSSLDFSDVGKNVESICETGSNHIENVIDLKTVNQQLEIKSTTDFTSWCEKAITVTMTECRFIIPRKQYIPKKMWKWKNKRNMSPGNLLSNRHDWCILWAYSLLKLSLIGLSFPWIFFSFVSPLEIKQNQRKTKETRGKPYNPLSPKPKKSKGNRRKRKQIKGFPAVKNACSSDLTKELSRYEFQILKRKPSAPILPPMITNVAKSGNIMQYPCICSSRNPSCFFLFIQSAIEMNVSQSNPKIQVPHNIMQYLEVIFHCISRRTYGSCAGYLQLYHHLFRTEKKSTETQTSRVFQETTEALFEKDQGSRVTRVTRTPGMGSMPNIRSTWTCEWPPPTKTKSLMIGVLVPLAKERQNHPKWWVYITV